MGTEIVSETVYGFYLIKLNICIGSNICEARGPTHSNLKASDDSQKNFFVIARGVALQ